MKNNLHERVLQVAFQANPDRPVALSSEDIYWKLEDPHLEIPRIKEVLESLVAKGDMQKDLGKYILDRFTFFDLKKHNNPSPQPTKKAKKKGAPKKAIQPPKEQEKNKQREKKLPLQSDTPSSPKEQPKVQLPQASVTEESQTTSVSPPDSSQSTPDRIPEPIASHPVFKVKPLSHILSISIAIQLIALVYFTSRTIGISGQDHSPLSQDTIILIVVLWLSLATMTGVLFYLRKISSHILSLEVSP